MEMSFTLTRCPRLMASYRANQLPNNSMQRTARHAAADAGRWAASTAIRCNEPQVVRVDGVLSPFDPVSCARLRKTIGEALGIPYIYAYALDDRQEFLMKRALYCLLIFVLGLGCGIAVGSFLSNRTLREQQGKHEADMQALFTRVNDLERVVRLTELRATAKQNLEATEAVNTGIGELNGFNSLDGVPLGK